MDLQNSQDASEIFCQAAAANLNCSLRRGAVDYLPRTGKLYITGDIHDNGLNLQRAITYAGLAQNPNHHLILHEVIHGPNRVNGRDLSVRTLAKVAALKVRYPGQVHVLQSNHELAQIRGEDILKQGTSVVAAFNEGVDFIYGDEASEVRAAIDQYVRSMLLAVRCENGLMISHSLPSPTRMTGFDPKVLDRVPTAEDLSPRGSGYLMVWGRSHTQAQAVELSRTWGVKMFVMGHQPAEMGYEIEGPSLLVLASDHDHGVLLPVDLSQEYENVDQLVEQIIPLNMVLL